LFKASKVQEDDSLIKFATTFYDDVKDHKRAALSHYYYAQYFMNKSDFSNSMIELKAAQSFCKDDNYLMNARIHELMAEIYANSYNVSEAINHRQYAAHYYSLAGKELNSLYSSVDLSREYAKAKGFHKSISILDSISNKTTASDSMFLGYLNDSYIVPYLNLHQPANAYDRYLKSMNYLGKNSDMVSDITIVVSMFTTLGQPDSAEYHLKLYERTHPNIENDENYHSAKYVYSKANKDYVTSLGELEQMFDIHNNKVRKVLTKDAAFAERDYYNNQALLEHEKVQKNRTIYISIIMIMLIIICVEIIYHKERIRRKAQEVEEKIYEAKDLNTSLSELNDKLLNLSGKLNDSQSQIDNLSTEIKYKVDALQRQKGLIDKLFIDHFNTLNTLSNEYFEKRDSEITRATIIKDFEKEIEKVRKDDSMNKLQEIVNECRDNVIKKLQDQLPRFKESDIKFLTLVIAGFSPKSICLVLDLKIGNYYNKWTRLRARIADSDAPDKELFLQLLAK
jgi:hypothetical protein